jgi:hypothetical protein
MSSYALAWFSETRGEDRFERVGALLTKWSDFCPTKELDCSTPFEVQEAYLVSGLKPGHPPGSAR